MEGRAHDGISITLASFRDEERAGIWRALLRGEVAGIFRICPEYELVGASHLAIHEIEYGSARFAASARATGPGETIVRYRRIAGFGPIDKGQGAGRSEGIVLVFTDCTDAAREDEYNEWYSGHLHHTVESIDFYAANRYVADDPDRAPSKYLAVYESRSGDPAKVQRDGIQWWVQGGFASPDCMALRNEVAAKRVD